MLCPLPPIHTSPPPLPFLLGSPPALIYTRVIESFCSSLQKITVPSKMQKSRRRQSPSAYWSRKIAAKEPAAVRHGESGYKTATACPPLPSPDAAPRAGVAWGATCRAPTDRAAPLAGLRVRSGSLLPPRQLHPMNAN